MFYFGKKKSIFRRFGLRYKFAKNSRSTKNDFWIPLIFFIDSCPFCKWVIEKAIVSWFLRQNIAKYSAHHYSLEFLSFMSYLPVRAFSFYDSFPFTRSSLLVEDYYVFSENRNERARGRLGTDRGLRPT